MFGSFWRAHRSWSSCRPRPEGEDSTDDGFPTDRGRVIGHESPLGDFSPLGGELVVRQEPRTPGPGAAWSGGRL
jgi:hypothetical protein